MIKTFLPRLRANWPYLFWLGPLLIVVGFSAAAVAGKWTGVPQGLAIAGAVISCLGLLWLAKGAKGFWGRRSTQVGTNALISTLAVVVMIGLVNFLAVRFDHRIDLTDQQALSLAPQSQQVVANLKQPVKLLVFETQPNPTTQSLLDQYKRQSDAKFSYQFVDPQAEPGLAQKYKPQALGDAFLESGKKIEPVAGGVTEVNLTPALQRLFSDRKSTAYFTFGHGEVGLESGQASLSDAVKALEQKNTAALPLNLLTTGKVPTDASVVIVAGPKKAFLPAEVALLEAYLKTGGGLMLMLDPQTKPGLEPLLKSWGVSLDNRIVVDASGAGQLVGLGPAAAIINQYGDHPITRNFNQGFSFFPLAQAVTAQPVDQDQVTDLLKTAPQSWAEANPDSQQLQFDPQTDRQGPLNLGVAISRPLVVAGQPAKQARMVVIGDSEFAANSAFGQSLNGDLFLNAIAWLSDRDDQALSIRPKEATNRRLQMTVTTSNWIGLFSIALLPLAAFVGAAVLWWKRR
jgi:ABC-type uncharacterized transport system involved in gliding motility auxiliary subunit